MIQTGQIYRHYKGGMYKIIAVGLEVAEPGHSARKMVVYQNIDPDIIYIDIDNPEKIWIRDITIFQDTLLWNNQTVKRFILETI